MKIYPWTLPNKPIWVVINPISHEPFFKQIDECFETKGSAMEYARKQLKKLPPYSKLDVLKIDRGWSIYDEIK